MKNILTLALAAVAVFGFNAVATAQNAGPKGGFGAGQGRGGPGGPGGGPGGMMGRRAQMEKELFAKLSLKPDQKVKIAAAQKKRDDAMKKLFEASGGKREGMREKFKPIQDAYTKDLEKILDKAQQAKYKAARKEMRDKMMKNRPGGPGGPGGPPPGGPGGRPPGG